MTLTTVYTGEASSLLDDFSVMDHPLPGTAFR